MLTLYGHPLSSPSNKVRMTAHAVGEEYDFILIDLSKGEQKSEKYLAVNPVGQVPAIEDGDLMLFESNAICKYLARKNRSALAPEEPATQARVDQWTDLVSNLLNTGYTRLLYNKVVAPQIGVEADDNAIREGEEMLARALPIIEAQLGRGGFLAGGELSLADIALLATMDPTEILEVDLSTYPKLAAWREDLRGRDFYTRVHAHYGEGFFD